MHHDNGIWVSADDLNREESFVAASNQEFTVESAVENGTNWESSRRDFLKVLGFGIGTATLAACETPVKKAIPYVTKPDEIVPGVANYFASTIVQGGDYCSVLVKTREGRPIKIEGNSLSAVTGGGTSARAQAAVLSLYDTKRIKSAGTIGGGAVTEKPWAELDREVKAKLAAGNVRIITNTIISPSADAAITEFTTRYPNTEVITYDPVSASALLDASLQCFNLRAVPNYDFGAADVIVSFGADFLGTWVSPIQYAKAYAKNRKIGKKKKTMNRHYQVESFMSLTGASADNRIPVRPSEQGVAIAYLYSKLAGQGAPAGLNEKAAKALDKVAADLQAARGKSLVVCGSNNVAEQVIALKINELLGNLGNTVKAAGYSTARQGDDKAVAKLISDMNAGQVGTLIVLGGANPAWELPNAEAFKAAFAKVGTRVSTSTILDETTLLCTHAAPAHHILESWGDASPANGQFSLIQPTIAPIFKTRQAEHSLLEWADSPNLDRSADQPYYEYVKKQWQTTMFGRQTQFATTQAFWDMCLHNGVFSVEDTTATPTTLGGSVDLNAITKPAQGTEIAFYETVNIGGGQYAHNPWLQEMPDPVTRTVWGNYLSIPNNWDGVNTISGWNNLLDGDKVDVEIGGKKLTCTVVRTFGLAPDTFSIALGGGREAGGCGNGYGVNVNPLLPQAGGYTQYFVSGATVSGKVGVDADFACVQHHHTMGVTAMGTEEGVKINADEKALGWKGFQGSLTNRSIIFPGNLHTIGDLEAKMTEFHETSEHLNSQTLYPERESFFGMGVKWEMFIDLNACIGCGACQVACVAENNVPVVGKKEVHRHHEMTWLRIDRYFYGDFENPKVVYQPMMCQHCDNAPCENVCPVAATPHSMEGLNQMAYNRCIGTRYCANNCPYKVRRFNWLDYTTADLWGGNEERVFFGNEGDDKPFYADNLVRMVLNPDVTVRTRGVIEKCSFCVQRIQEGKLTAKRESREVADHDVRTACQTACPTDAIVFGNVNNKESELNQRMANSGPLAYQVLEEINVRPGVHYTAKVLNTNSALDA
jgi:MoCo/4Fe-4S cofactor protein with predicted Tat translocation signal